MAVEEVSQGGVWVRAGGRMLFLEVWEMANWRGVAAVLLVLAGAVRAEGQDWRAVEQLRPGTRLVVAMPPSRYGPGLEDRCRLVVADAASLTCLEEGSRARVVYPLGQVESVYRVRGKFPVGAVVGLALLGVFIGGVASDNGPAVGVGLLGGLVGLFLAMADSTARFWDRAFGVPPPPPDERLELVYYRGFVTGAAPGASIP